MKTYNNKLKRFEFRCNKCNELISCNENEQEALQEARKILGIGGGKWEHPHWGIICPNCMVYKGKVTP